MHYDEDPRALEVCKARLQRGAGRMSALIKDDLDALAACCICPLQSMEQDGLQVWQAALQAFCQPL